jgi:hypothetical protein
MGAQIKFRREECAEGTGQRSNYAAVLDAQITPRKEEFTNKHGAKVKVKLCSSEGC